MAEVIGIVGALRAAPCQIHEAPIAVIGIDPAKP